MSFLLDMGFPQELVDRALNLYDDDIYGATHWCMMQEFVGNIPEKMKQTSVIEETWIGSKIHYESHVWNVYEVDTVHAFLHIYCAHNGVVKWIHMSDPRIEWINIHHDDVSPVIPRKLWSRKLGTIYANPLSFKQVPTCAQDCFSYLRFVGLTDNYLKRKKFWQAVYMLSTSYLKCPEHPDFIFQRNGCVILKEDCISKMKLYCDVHKLDWNHFYDLLQFNLNEAHVMFRNVGVDIENLTSMWMNPMRELKKRRIWWLNHCISLLNMTISEEVLSDIPKSDFDYEDEFDEDGNVYKIDLYINNKTFEFNDEANFWQHVLLNPQRSCNTILSFSDMFKQKKQKEVVRLKRKRISFQPKSSLFNFQRRCLDWMIKRESDERCHWSQMGEDFKFWHSEFGQWQLEPPPKCIQGGILCQNVGMGKTVEIIHLLCYSNLCTLIIVPTSMLSVWHNEIKKHAPDLKVCVFHGSRRRLDRTAQVVLTTYGICVSDSKRSVAMLSTIPWERIVIDEAHTLNYKSRTYQSILALNSRKKWLLTATPFLSGESSLICYLNLFGYRLTSLMLACNSRVTSIRTSIEKVSQRLVWSESAVQNYEIEEHDKIIDSDNLDLYNALKVSIRKRHESPGVPPNMAIHWTQWLRVAANCPHLVDLAHFGTYTHESASISNHVTSFLDSLDDSTYSTNLKDTISKWCNGESKCVVCWDVIDRPTLTPCNHLFCYECIQNVYTHDVRKRCPLCRTENTDDPLRELTRTIRQPDTISICELNGKTVKVP